MFDVYSFTEVKPIRPYVTEQTDCTCKRFTSIEAAKIYLGNILSKHAFDVEIETNYPMGKTTWRIAKNLK